MVAGHRQLQPGLTVIDQFDHLGRLAQPLLNETAYPSIILNHQRSHDQVRYALSQWFLGLRHGRRARRVLLEDAAALIAYHRRHNSEAKLGHTRTMRTKLRNSGLEVDQIKTCLESNFALYC